MDHFIVCINSGYFFILFRSIFYQLVDSLISSYESCVFDSISSFTLTMCNALATINHGKFITVLSSYFCVPVLIGFQFLHVEIDLNNMLRYLYSFVTFIFIFCSSCEPCCCLVYSKEGMWQIIPTLQKYSNICWNLRPINNVNFPN